MEIDGSHASRLLSQFLDFEDILEEKNEDHLDELLTHFDSKL